MIGKMQQSGGRSAAHLLYRQGLGKQCPHQADRRAEAAIRSAQDSASRTSA